MPRLRLARKEFFLFVMLILGTVALTPIPASAQGDNPLSVSLPSVWEDLLTPDILAEFESQYPGYKVYASFTGDVFSQFNVANSTIDSRLDDAEALVTSADVLYAASGTLTYEGTQAGYFLDLKPLVDSDSSLNVNDFIPGIWQSVQWDGGIWEIPTSANVILVTYNPDAFDQANLPYPTEQWTLVDFADAARQLTQYDDTGAVSTPGMSLSGGSDISAMLMRSLLSTGVYDPSTTPYGPLLNQPEVESLLTTWYELEQEGVISGQGGFGGGQNDIPLRVGGVNTFSGNPFGDNAPTYNAVLLPGGVGGLSVQGFAVSAASQYPEMAYALAVFLSSRSELIGSSFGVASPARYSMIGAETTNNGGGFGGGPGGPGRGGFSSIPAEIQPVVDLALNNPLVTSEMRYIPYLNTALSQMQSNGGDAASALQTAEELAVNDLQTAIDRRGTTSLIVAPPPVEVVLTPGEIALNCAVNLGFGGGQFGGGQLPNQTEWDRITADIIANDPEIGAIHIEAVNQDDLTELAGQYDCFILPSNAVPGGDLDSILSLDPLLDADPTFDRNDIIGNILSQLQQGGLTWALPLAVQVQTLEYDSQQFAYAGVPEPVNGWTTDAFTDALQMLASYNPDVTPFVPTDPSGAYLLMLIGAYGGLPLDYRVDPPAINFTDPATIDAIRQVLDLISRGYIAYSAQILGGGGEFNTNDDGAPITTGTGFGRGGFGGFGGGRGGVPGQATNTQTLLRTTYPQGSVYNVIALQVTTGYISATTQYPDATYRFLSEISINPQLFLDRMPVRQSLVSSPDVIAAQGEDVASLYQQVDTLLRSPNTVIFPTLTAGGGGGAINFIREYWLRRAFDHYILNSADLETELSEAQLLTQSYEECVAALEPVSDDQGQGGFGQQFIQCASTVDPNFGQD